jgi:hypothetical protein
VASYGSNGNNYQLLKLSRVTTTGTAGDTSTNIATAIDIATDSETATATATWFHFPGVLSTKKVC